MTTCYLITPLAKNFPIDRDAVYIGVDAGYRLIEEKGLTCLRKIGDFDSMEGEAPQDAWVLPVQKDETDSQVAAEWAIDQGYSPVILWGGLEGRLDHTLANLLMAGWKYPQLILQDENHKVITLLEGEIELEPEYRHLSFFALEDTELSLANVKYPVEHALLSRQDIYAVSNSFLEGNARISVEWGRVLCIQSQCR